MNRCELCGREELPLTRHHLIPRTRHKNKHNQKTFDRDDVRDRIAMLCRECHKYAHRVLTEKQMERDYNTVEALAAHPKIQKFIDWIRSKPPGLKVRHVRPGSERKLT